MIKSLISKGKEMIKSLISKLKNFVLTTSTAKLATTVIVVAILFISIHVALFGLVGLIVAIMGYIILFLICIGMYKIWLVIQEIIDEYKASIRKVR